MNSPSPPNETNVEWVLQERARQEERSRTAVGPGARLNRYRLISRVLHEPLRETLPRDFLVAAPPSTGRHSTVFPRQRAILITTGVGYLAAMTTAAFLVRTDIGHAVTTFAWPTDLLAILAALSLAAPRIVALVRALERPAGELPSRP